jgi:hypothetical protein
MPETKLPMIAAALMLAAVLIPAPGYIRFLLFVVFFAMLMAITFSGIVTGFDS